MEPTQTLKIPFSNGTPSDSMSEDSDSGSELKKRDRPDWTSNSRNYSDQKQGNNTNNIAMLKQNQVPSIFNIAGLLNRQEIQLDELNLRREEILEQLNDLRTSIGKKVQSGDNLDVKSQSSKCHRGFLIKEMKWMAEDFERETKKKIGDSKRQARACKKQIHEKNLKKEKEIKDQKIELRKKAVNMSRMVQQFWKSIEKVVKHNYNVLYEKKRQQIRTRKLENFVSKHLKLSVKVAEELNTKSFVEQSMHNKEGSSFQQSHINESNNNQDTRIMKLYSSQDEDAHQKEIAEINDVENDERPDLRPYKRQKINVTVVKDKDGYYEVDQDFEKLQQLHSQVLSQNNEDKHISRTLIAEQTVEMAKALQPTGFTLSSANVKTKVPFLLQGDLREYQIIGLDWLVTLHNKKLNGILADEMGLGKTIQTISMLASLACDKGIWGPHLIVVPTTIIINWEMEFKKWCPAFKILTYFGSQKERKMKRHGWSKENSFHVCITSYKLVIQDHFAFRRKKWYYMVLDEAQNIKNFKSQRWQTLLRFNTKRRLLLTGTPLQNDVMELWSLMHFLMPNIFSSQQDFKEWFSNPFNQSINQNQSLNISVVQKLQSILRPFLLRRMKRDVEKQLPEKVEHIVQCNLSRRQRLLYDEYINSDKTKQTLCESDFFSIMNVLMQLRKVCNHPDLFEARSIESPFIMQERLRYNFSSFIYKVFQYNPLKNINMQSLNFILSEFENISRSEYQTLQELYPRRPLIQVIGENKNHIDNLSDHLLSTRPLADGFAVGRKLPINCNVFAKSNTKSLQHTLPTVLPYESNIYHDIPSYLNTACLPFAQHFYSLNSFDQMRYSQRNKEFNEYDYYMSALYNEEQRAHLVKFANKLIQWRQVDTTNRTNLILRKPVFGEDCRRAVKVNFLFSDVFEVKRHKNLDKNSKTNYHYIKDLDKAPSSIFNVFAQTISMNSTGAEREALNQNKVEDWQELSEEQIEIYNNQNPFIKEVPMSLQIKNKKKKKQLKELLKQQHEEQQKKLQQQALELKAQMIQQQEQIVEEKVLFTEKEFYLIIDKAGIAAGDQSKEQNEDEGMTDTEQNPNIQVVIKEVQKERVEQKVIMVDVPYQQQQFQLQQNMNDTVMIDQTGGVLDQQVNFNKQPLTNEDLESPYQRIYQNASKRFKKESDQREDLGQDQQVLQLKVNNICGIESQDFNSAQSLTSTNVNNNAENHGNNNDQQQWEEQDQQKQTLQQMSPARIIDVKADYASLDNQQKQNEYQDLSDHQDQKQQVQNENVITSANNNILPQSNEGHSQNDSQPNTFDNSKLSYEQRITYKNCEVLRDMIITPLQRVQILEETIKHYKFIIPKVVAQTCEFVPSKIVTQNEKDKAYERFLYQKLMSHRNVNQSLKFSNILYFPHKNLIQYDCGKLQRLAILLKNLYSKGHKVLIFTQMTRILDILENFLNLHGYTYVRLDGSVKVENRQRMVDKFNLNKKIFCFISSTRCGGIGINLTGADCVIFYDTDWNPAMDKQAQDRCHRIGQTKTVHIYRLISVNTIEENIFKKSLQKRDFGGLIIEGNFDMEFFKKVSLKDILDDESIFKPRRRDLLKEENIIFHTNNQNLGLGDDEEQEVVNELDFEKQREIENYRKRFEEALVRIEDKEDVIALQQAKREIDDEFDEDALQQDGGATTTATGPSSKYGGGDAQSNADQTIADEENQGDQNAALDSKSANQLQKEMKKSEFINWRTHATLNDVTKMCIEQYEHGYTFDSYLEERSKKDNKFVNPLKDDEEEEKEEKDDKGDENNEDSEFSLSDEDDQMSQNEDQQEEAYDRALADALYKRTREEIESKYFVI